MEESLFRGIAIPKSEGQTFNHIWVEGDLIISDGKYYIHPRANKVRVEGELGKLIVMHEVIPETVGRFTGLNDKNGKKIFEGDVVSFKTTAYHYKKCRIEYQSCYARYCAIDNKEYVYPMDKDFKYEVIGNIHDNLELLKTNQGRPDSPSLTS